MTDRFRSPRALAALAASLLAAPAALADDVMVVFDGSNSMWGQIDGTAKIEIARGAMDRLLGDWTAERNVGLMAYGHRRRGDCGDIETLLAPAPGNAAAIQERIDAITPTGRTPLTDAVGRAAAELASSDRPATVVLISDGVESCDRDPCSAAAALERAGVGFTAHVVGFGVGSEEAASLACIAEETGGLYLSAADAGELGGALGEIATAVETEPEPDPEPEITLTAPSRALAGEAFDVSWQGAVSGSDIVTVVAAGAEAGAIDNHLRVRDATEGTLRAPGTPGLYEVRYVLDEGRRTLATAPIEVAEPEVSLRLEQDDVRAGDRVAVSWTGAVSGSDIVTLVPMGAGEGTIETHVRVRGETAGALTAPETPGLYEVRYVLDEGRRTLARATLEVLDARAPLDRGAQLDAPETAAPGATIAVGWTTESESDDRRITLAEEGQALFTWISAVAAEGDGPAEVALPDDAGVYELRFLDVSNREILARRLIEVR